MPLNLIFYQVVRVFINGQTDPQRSVQFYNDYSDAEKRFYAIIAADISNPEITYHGTYIIDSTGMVREKKVFDRRDFTQEEIGEQNTPEE